MPDDYEWYERLQLRERLAKRKAKHDRLMWTLVWVAAGVFLCVLAVVY